MKKRRHRSSRIATDGRYAEDGRDIAFEERNDELREIVEDELRNLGFGATATKEKA